MKVRPKTNRRSLKLEDVLPKGWLDLFTEHPRIAIGVDLSTTTNKKSNPTSIAVGQEVGLVKFTRLLLRFKNDKPEVMRWLLRAIVKALRDRGLSVRVVAIDATNERFFATDLRDDLAAIVPVELVITSEKTKYRGEEMLMKSYLGNLLVNTCDDGYLALPSGKWVEIDMRQTVRDRGTFVSEVLADGGHADCFCAIANMLHGFEGAGGPAKAEGAPVGTYGAGRGGGSNDPARNRGRIDFKSRGAGVAPSNRRPSLCPRSKIK